MEEKRLWRPLDNNFYEKYKNKIDVKKSWWFRISKKRWFNAWKGLKPTQRSILLSLWLYGANKGFCYPSERRLSTDLGIDKATTCKNIKILEKKGFIKIEKTIGQRGKYHKYFLLK